MSSDAGLRGKHAVVTGGARGIGLGIAALFADRGLRVSIVSRSARAPHADERFFRAEGDVTDETQVAAALDACREANGPIAVLVNNSGIAESAPLLRTSLPMWNQILATNLTGTFLCTRAAAEDMIVAKWGRIVNVASTAALGGAAYSRRVLREQTRRTRLHPGDRRGVFRHRHYGQRGLPGLYRNRHDA